MSKTYNSSTLYNSLRFVSLRQFTLLLLLLLSLKVVAQQQLPTTTQRQGAVKKSVETQQPLFNGITLSTDLFEPMGGLLGMSYTGYNLALEAGFRNRYFAVWEIGLGTTDHTPDDMKFTYQTPLSLYNRVGINYNFYYKSENPNMFYVGARYGFSAFRYDIVDIEMGSEYWGEQKTVNITDQHSTAHWAELVAGVRVWLNQNLAMGWSVRYKFMLALQESRQSSPWYIPGFGTKSLPVGFTYSIYYKLPL